MKINVALADGRFLIYPDAKSVDVECTGGMVLLVIRPLDKVRTVFPLRNVSFYEIDERTENPS